MTTGGESQLEKFIVDFVQQKTMHRVRLHLADDITVRPVNIPPTGTTAGTHSLYFHIGVGLPGVGVRPPLVHVSLTFIYLSGGQI